MSYAPPKTRLSASTLYSATLTAWSSTGPLGLAGGAAATAGFVAAAAGAVVVAAAGAVVPAAAGAVVGAAAAGAVVGAGALVGGAACPHAASRMPAPPTARKRRRVTRIVSPP